MSGWLVGLVGFAYLYVAIEQAWRGNTGMAVIYVGYTIANGGFWWTLK